VTSKHIGFLLVLPLVAVITTTAVATDFSPEVEQQASDIFHSVMSPFCPGKLLADCPSSQAGALRQQIRERIAAGESGDAIRQELIETYGEAVRAAPRARGFDLLAWVLPPVALGLGALIAVLWLRRRRPAASTAGEGQGEAKAAIDDEARKRLEEELRRVS
jgi:cytochrome c-type biogenesis protein CcmH